MDGKQRCHFMIAHKGRDCTICLLIACCQRASTLQWSGSFFNATTWHGWDRSTLLVLTYTLCISKLAKDANKSSGCHVGTQRRAHLEWVFVCASISVHMYASVRAELYLRVPVMDSNRVSSCLPLSSVSCCLEPVLPQVENGTLS